MRPIAIYTAARLAIFAVLAAGLYVLGVGGLLGLAIAVVLSMPLSYLLLRRQLADVTAWFEQRRAEKADVRADIRHELAEDEGTD